VIVVPMTKTRQALGQWGERVAASYLVGQGLVLLDRNWRTASGEIDIIAKEGESLVFCEVKTRRGTAFGDGAEAVAGRKSIRLRRLASQWLALSGLRPREVRFDVVSVLVCGGQAPVVTHLRDAF
jgi:putative endonuclease